MKEGPEKEYVTKSKLPLFVSIGLVATAVACYFFIPSFQQTIDEAWQVLTSNDEARIEQWVDGFGWLGPVVLIVAMTVQMFLLVIPSIALMVVSILAYGPIWGSLIIFISVFVASTIGYFIGRYLGTFFIERLIGQSTEKKITAFLEDYGFWAIVVTRINPLLSNDAISFVAGILKMGYWRFIGATLLGIIPLTIFLAFIGKSTDRLMNGLIWGSVFSLLLFAGYVWWDKKRNTAED